jgi:hypothetical protein
MYTIANLIYGFPLHNNTSNQLKWSDELEEAVNNEEPGFLTFYDGGLDVVPSAFGVIIKEFDVCVHHTDLYEIDLFPTDHQIQLFNDQLNNLTPTLQEEIKKYGIPYPRRFILWSSS